MSATIGLISCGGENTPSNVKAPGAEKDAKSKTLEVGCRPVARQNTAEKNKCLPRWFPLLQRKHQCTNGSTSLCFANK